MAILEAKIGSVYHSRSKIPCKILDVCQHGQDCSIRMIYYTNLTPTFDSPAGKRWVMEESLFLSIFNEIAD
jgi:hypothetical protein